MRRMRRVDYDVLGLWTFGGKAGKIRSKTPSGSSE
jgi:hypothetical protein